MDDTTGRVTGGAYDEDPDLRTREIRDEIAQTRVEMSETIEAIQERLTPGNLAAQAGETVRNAASEKVKQMAHTAEHAAEQIRESSFVETIRANPVPSALIGIGAAWLMIKGRSDSDRSSRQRRYASYRADAGRDWRTVSSIPSAVGTSGSASLGAEYGAGYSGDSGRVAELGGDMNVYGGRDYGQRPSVTVNRVVRENPLAIGAAAALVGVAIGLSIPATDAENRVLGEARDTVVDRAREAANEATDKVKDAVGLGGDTNARAASTDLPGASEANTSGSTRAGTTRRGGSGRSSLS